MQGTSAGENLVPLTLGIKATCRRNNAARRRREQQEVQINQGERGPHLNHPLSLSPVIILHPFSKEHIMAEDHP